nr:hypothetical protein [Algoriphagus sp.]
MILWIFIILSLEINDSLAGLTIGGFFLSHSSKGFIFQFETNLMMKKYLSFLAFAAILSSCQTSENTEVDYTQMSDEERLEIAKE